MKFVTDQALGALAVLQNRDDAGRAEVLADGSAVYAHVRANEWITEEALRRWGEGVGIGPDRMTAAIAFLNQTDQMVAMPLPADLPETAETGETGP